MHQVRVPRKFIQISYRASLVKEIMVLRGPENQGGRKGRCMYVRKKEKERKINATR